MNPYNIEHPDYQYWRKVEEILIWTTSTTLTCCALITIIILGS